MFFVDQFIHAVNYGFAAVPGFFFFDRVCPSRWLAVIEPPFPVSHTSFSFKINVFLITDIPGFLSLSEDLSCVFCEIYIVRSILSFQLVAEWHVNFNSLFLGIYGTPAKQPQVVYNYDSSNRIIHNCTSYYTRQRIVTLVARDTYN